MQTPFKLASYIELKNKRIGSGYPVFVMAEIGINHNGDINIAKKMIEVAALAGVDSVKFQTFRAEEFMADKTMVYEYECGGEKVQENMFEMFKRLEMPIAWHEELFDYAEEKGLIPLTSVGDTRSLDLVDQLAAPAFKLSSEDLINLPLIEYAAKKGKPLIISTGMADREEVEDVMEILSRHRLNEVVFLHAVSVYPTPECEVNLLRMKSLEKIVNGSVGYSDHTMGIEAALGAVTLGACVIEKHFTLDRNMQGPDHSFSADPEELSALVKSIRKTEKLIGEGEFEPSILEKNLRNKFRRSIVASRNLSAGHVLQRDDMALKRPGMGLKGNIISELCGSKLVCDLMKDDLITRSSLV